MARTMTALDMSPWAGMREIAAPRTCNRHNDCDAADARAKAADPTRVGAEHCRNECCEECFGN